MLNVFFIENCISELKKLLGKNLLSAIIDGAGGPLYTSYPKLMRTGGIIANYGQTASMGGATYSMAHVIKNIDVRGSTMGSREEFKKMVKFVDEKKIKPVVSHVWKGLNSNSVDQAFSTMR
jgi:D-arabinose 1-dehydrogenase-like Zn-dependent alcohol dehydrogenase